MKRLCLAWPLAVLIATVGQACSGPDIPLATLPESDAAAPHVCTSNESDCPAGFYCDKATCGASTGTCQPIPTSGDATESPVCGCDGVTYYDDCLRKANGIAAMTPFPCGLDSAVTCGGASGGTCPRGALCAQFVRPAPGPCPDLPGTCWAVPSPCPPPSLGMMGWDSCSSAQKCIDTCSAIRQGGAYRHGFMCP